ncbi:hypothetical protein FHU33_3641 [Blastococcus colisei]|uniref:Uncharacterized protein n=1 Tax=Blastococcus colisei TaxID=1564162 RepID=A0A543PJA1_9ACTN|nr:hypothetical protein FHU33_3641 [Blastococcus colisei]
MAEVPGVKLRRRLTARFVGTARHVGRRVRDAWQSRKPIWLPRLRRARKIVVVAAVLVPLIVLGIADQVSRRLADASALTAGTVAETTDGNAFVHQPSPWDVIIQKVRDVAPDIPRVHIGFGPLADLSLTPETDADTGGASPAAAGSQPQFMTTPFGLVMGVAALAAVGLGIVRRQRRGRQDETSNGDSQRSPGDLSMDFPQRDVEKAVKDHSRLPRSEDPTLQLAFQSPVDLHRSPPDAPQRRPARDNAVLATPAVRTPTMGHEGDRHQAPQEDVRTDARRSPAPPARSPKVPPAGALSPRIPLATPEARERVHAEDTTSRVVLFTATKWHN